MFISQKTSRPAIVWIASFIGGGVLFFFIWSNFVSPHEHRTGVLLATRPDVKANGYINDNTSAASTPVVESTPVAGKPPIERPDFNSAKDLWAFALAAKNNSSPAIKYEGMLAAKECAVVEDRLEPLKASILESNDAAKLQRLEAVDAVHERCKGFIMAGRKSSIELMKELEGINEKTAIGSILKKNKITAADFQELLNSGSGNALEAGLISASKIWVSKAQLNGGGPSTELFTYAALQAACDLGKDCGKSSFQNILMCANSGMCSDDLWSGPLKNSTEQERKTIEDYRKQINEMVKQGKYKDLGLSD